jgi:outer membrane murein-binding lipoprotein Lpp
MMTALTALRDLICGWVPGRGDSGERAKLNGEKEKLRELAARVDALSIDLNAVTSAIKDAPTEAIGRCSGCPLPKMKARLRKGRRK